MFPHLMARAWFAATALAVLVGLVVQTDVTAGIQGGHFPDLGPRMFNMFSYFTIQSNIIVGITSLMLALRLPRRSTAFQVLRLTGVIAILVTFVVFHVALKGLQDLQGSAAFADLLLHTISPILCVMGWLAFGPRGKIHTRVVVLTFVFPAAWAVFTLIKGPIVDYYPYPFVDVRELGYPQVLLNGVLIAALFMGLAAAAAGVDKALGRGPASAMHPA